MSFWRKQIEQARISGGVISPSGAWQSENNATSEGTALDPYSTATLERRFGSFRSALSAGTVIQGRLSFDVPVRVDGKLSGELYSSQPVIIGSSAKVNATIEAPTVIIQGQVTGNIIAKERVEVLAGSAVEGDLKTTALVLQEGAYFNGNISITSCKS